MTKTSVKCCLILLDIPNFMVPVLTDPEKLLNLTVQPLFSSYSILLFFQFSTAEQPQQLFKITIYFLVNKYQN